MNNGTRSTSIILNRAGGRGGFSSRGGRGRAGRSGGPSRGGKPSSGSTLGQLHTTRDGGIHKNTVTSTITRGRGKGRSIRGGKVKISETTDTISSIENEISSPPAHEISEAAEADEVDMEMERGPEDEFGIDFEKEFEKLEEEFKLEEEIEKELMKELDKEPERGGSGMEPLSKRHQKNPTRYILGGSPMKKCIGLRMPQSVLKKIHMAGDKGMKISFSNGIVIIHKLIN